MNKIIITLGSSFHSGSLFSVKIFCRVPNLFSSFFLGNKFWERDRVPLGFLGTGTLQEYFSNLCVAGCRL